MSAADAIAKARAIAAKLGMGSANPSSGGVSSDLGKRKSRDEDGGSYYQPQASGAGLGFMTKKKVYIPVREHPDVNFLGLIIGPRGRTQKELEARTGARILVRGRGSQKDGAYSGPTGNPDDDDEQHVSIEGTEEAVAKAQIEVEELLFNPEKAQQIKNEQLRALSDEKSALQKYSGGGGSVMTNSDGESSIELQIPNHLVGYLIGKSGENIQKLQRDTGAHCQIAKESDMRPGETMRCVVLTGSEGGVREAKRLVDELVQEKMQGMGGGRDDRKPKDNQEQLDRYAMILKVAVPNEKVGLIIGKQGATVKGIQDRTMTFVHIPAGPDEDDRNVRTLSIAGDTRESVEAAQMEIAMQLQQNILQRSQEAAGGYAQPNTIFCAVPDDKVGIVIGRSGCTIKDIQSRYNVRIQIPPSADPGSHPPIRTVSIQGGPNEQMAAKSEIENMVCGGGGGGYHGGQGGGHYGNNGMGHYGQQHGGSYYAPQQGSYYQAQQSYDSYGQQQQMYQQQQPQQQPQQQQQQQSSGENATPADMDPTAYYTDFWNYAVYYGEAAARQYYTTWSPPEGTPPPDGFVIPAPVPSSNTDAPSSTTATGNATSSVEGAQMTAEQQQALYQEQWAEYYKQQALLQQQQPQSVQQQQPQQQQPLEDAASSTTLATQDSLAPPVPDNDAPPLPPS